MDYTKICFVVMPFGEKPVGDRFVNFNRIYDTVFDPAIRATTLPEGGNLIPRRTDRDFFSGEISNEMFQYIEYSRFVLADISGLNANVFYELGIRHRARESGTAIFRQINGPLPFDINHVKAFPYEYEPEEKIGESKKLITQVLTESLQQNRIDSPVQLTLKAQQNQQQNIQELLRDAENALRNEDIPTAIAKYREVIRTNGNNSVLRLKLGLLLKQQDDWQGALAEFAAAVTYSPSYAEAYREQGIAENKLYHQKGKPPGEQTGEESLLRAVELNPQDFDAFASLGGILKRQGRYKEALAMYQRATKESRGHTYPLLNDIKVRARIKGAIELEDQQKFLLARAERSLRKQVADRPPYNPPWSFFDLSEIRLYLGNRNEFLKLLEEGIQFCSASWKVKTHRDSLQLLVDGGVELAGLDEGMAKLEEAAKYLDELAKTSGGQEN